MTSDEIREVIREIGGDPADPASGPCMCMLNSARTRCDACTAAMDRVAQLREHSDEDPHESTGRLLLPYTSNSGKMMWICSHCGRAQVTPDKQCMGTK